MSEPSWMERSLTPAATGQLPTPLRAWIPLFISTSRGRPFEIEIGTGKVIKGWEEGMCTICNIKSL